MTEADLLIAEAWLAIQSKPKACKDGHGVVHAMSWGEVMDVFGLAACGQPVHWFGARGGPRSAMGAAIDKAIDSHGVYAGVEPAYGAPVTCLACLATP